MKDETSEVADPVIPSRRELLKTAVWATSVCVTGGAMQLGCSTSNSAAPATNAVRADATGLGAREVVEHIRKGDLKAEAYVTQLIDRYKAHKDLNAVITINEARLLQEAHAVDQARSRGDKLGPLAGLPFVIKDQIDVAGYPTTTGHTALKVYVPKQSATVVDTMLKAGGLVFAKTNCGPMIGGYPGRALSAATNNNPYFGPARNPYDPGRMSGGSSGGNAVAIAARFAPAGLGEDTGGSIRIPSAFCGIAGLRPSTFSIENAVAGTRRKRYSDVGIVPPTGFLETIGPMARTVSDVAFIDAALTGEPAPQTNLRDIRIGIPRADYWEQTTFDPGVQKVIQAAFSRLRDAGAQLIEVDLNAIARLAGGAPLPAGKASNAFADWLAQNIPGLTVEAINRLPRRAPYPATPGSSFARGPRLSPEATKDALVRTARQYMEVFQSHDIVALAFPSQVMPAPLINIHEDMVGQKIEVDGKWVDEFELILSNTRWGASLGAPSLNVPAGLTSGLPVGLIVQGAVGDDARILGLGIAVENVLGPIPPPPQHDAT